MDRGLDVIRVSWDGPCPRCRRQLLELFEARNVTETGTPKKPTFGSYRRKNLERPVKAVDLYMYDCNPIAIYMFTFYLFLSTVTSTDSSMIINSSNKFESKVDSSKTDHRMGRIDVFDVLSDLDCF